MRAYFLKFIIAFMRYDIALSKQRLQECKDVIAHDERRVHELEIELLGLEVGE